jgi:DNA-binding GntR family transcriptional regulator
MARGVGASRPAGPAREEFALEWRRLRLTKESPVPLYYQLAERIQELARAGDIAPGERLPSERELAEWADISRMTVRQAMAWLVREGVLVVRHGVGAFVAEPKRTYDAVTLLGFTEETARHGDAVGTRVLEQRVSEPSRAVVSALDLLPGEPIVKIVRLRSAGATPVLIETSCLAAARCPGLEEADLEANSLYALLEERYAIRLRGARQTIEATTAGEYESGLLAIEPGAPLLRLEGVAFADDGRPVEHFTATYRADRFKLALESRRDGDGLALSAGRPGALTVD